MGTKFFIKKNVGKSSSGLIVAFIVICVFFTQNLLISAKDLSVGNYTGLSPSLVYILQRESDLELNFNKRIANKYKGSKITDVTKGVKHIKMLRFYNNKPVRINVIELSKDVNHELSVIPAIASEKLSTKTKISNIAEKGDAIIAINGGYFKPETGVPLGTLMINKKVYTGPIYDRVAMGFFDENYDMARVKLKAKVETNIGDLKIDNVNQPRMLSTHTIVYTRDWGENTPPSPKYGTQLVIEKGKLVAISESMATIPKEGFVIVGPTQKLQAIADAKKFKLNIKINPEGDGVNHIISGGPYLVKNNEIFVDMTAQKLSSIGGRNPRTAIGYTADNHLIMLTADGREGASVGLTLMELAQTMKELGCVNAMNLDGGGSTVMYVQGDIVNKPAVRGGIPLSNTLIVCLK